MPDMTRGQVAYTLRESRFPWHEIGTLIGSEAVHRNIVAAADARKYAQQQHLPWPPPNKVGQRAYEMALENPWDEVAKQMKRSVKELRRLAQRYAEEAQVFWPPPSTVGQAAYRLGRRGITWEEIGEIMKREAFEVREAAQGFAESLDLVWPLPSMSRMMRRAYQLYARTELSWVDVAKMLDYSHPAHAVEGARRAAQIMEWEWPLSEGDRRGPGLKDPEEMSGCLPYHDRADGDTWDVIQERYGYGYRHNLMEAMKRYAERAGLAWPPGESESPHEGVG